MDPDASQTLGVGLYTTDSYEAAVTYSAVRQFNDQALPIVETFLPFQAKMLDFRLESDPTQNASVPKALFKEWLKFFESYIDSRAPSQREENSAKSLITNHGGLQVAWEQVDFRRESEDDYLERLKAMQTKPKVDLRVMFGTVTVGSPSWDRLITKFFLSKGYDGLIYIEGGEGKKKQDHNSYIFYNSKKVGTFNNWHGIS
ncbi:MAG: hypothetical protein NUV73_02640, partial [Candidatus Daviesbacteria bacterium]|nr:hypothetical protein [Candidatus Daviesbacteria bacterium]